MISSYDDTALLVSPSAYGPLLGWSRTFKLSDDGLNRSYGLHTEN